MCSSAAVRRGRFALALIATLVASAVCAGTALAGGGNYVFAGGKPRHHAQVRAALEASSFDWDVVPVQVTVHLVSGVRAHATPGHMWIDPALLSAGPFAWAVVQDEYAHQVDFFALSFDARERLRAALGAPVWCHADAPGLPHGVYGCERFTSTLVWAYWPDASNLYRPRHASAEAAALAPWTFRLLLAELLAPASLTERSSLPDPAL